MKLEQNIHGICGCFNAMDVSVNHCLRILDNLPHAVILVQFPEQQMKQVLRLAYLPLLEFQS